MQGLDNLIIILIIIILWSGDTIMIRVWIRFLAKKKWNKCKKTYPYFSGNIIQKLFLHGLRGSMDITAVILTYIFNISALLGIGTGIWSLISPENMIAEDSFRIIIGVWLFSYLLKCLVLYFSPPEF